MAHYAGEVDERESFLNSRERHPVSEAVVFLETQQIALPGQQPPVFSEQKGGLVSVDEAWAQEQKRALMWKEVDEEKDRLFALMIQVQGKISKRKNGDRQVQALLSETDLRRCSWGQVLAEVDRTAERWKGSPDKESKTMVFIDRIGKYSSALETWLGLLPMGDYGSRCEMQNADARFCWSICGVFKLAIGAATQYGSTGETIFQFLADIPDIMESARQTVALYREMGGHSLDRKSFELFRAVLKALNHIMQFFADSKLEKFFQVTIKQSAYKSDLQASIDVVKKQAQAFKEEANICHARQTYGNSRLLAKINEDNEHFQKSVLQMLESSPYFQSSRSERLAPDYRALPTSISGYDLANVDYSVSADEASEQPRYLGSRDVLQKQSNEDAAEARAAAEAARSKLLRLLQYDAETVRDDIASCLRRGHRLPEKGKSKAAKLFRNDDFRAFVGQSRASAGLLVNGRDDLAAAAADGISPLSLATAELTRISRSGGTTEFGQFFVVNFFCGEHRPRLSSLDHPAAAWQSSAVGMIASLVGQLLSQAADRGMGPDLSFMNDSRWRKAERLEPKVLCTVFAELVRQLPSGALVLCIVDGIAVYETRAMQPQTMLVMEKLVRLVGKLANGPQIFKLLATCQNRALAVSQLFRGRTLDLPETVDEDDAADYMISTMGRQRT
ncbi:hypothetical protein CTA2_11161 [Colletotrichum tanaceti]|uniref:Uncharacterized protein n=1 Tax=Colletotrichum tanaceti TaxID=1306861 RepID=A0A4U6XDV5_9PEZI|nr:hypothetical protein CTA2_11161 [Colletotrichum tanaceti]TKW53970.1 hypothetical protein CTA1_8188 [Colletotrichum tanaceti]